MLEITDINAPNVLVKEKNYLMMFYADWCPRCPPLTDILDGYQKKYRSFEFARINFDHNPLAVDYFEIQGVPTVLAIKDNSVIGGWAGLDNSDAYLQIIDIAFSPPDKKLSQIDLDNLAAIGIPDNFVPE